MNSTITGCISAVFVSALAEFVNNHLLTQTRALVIVEEVVVGLDLEPYQE